MIRRRWIGVLLCALPLAVADCSGRGGVTAGGAGTGGTVTPTGGGGNGGTATPTGGVAGTAVTSGTGGEHLADAGQPDAPAEGGRGGSVAGTGGAATGGTAGPAGAGGSAPGGAGGPATGGAGSVDGDAAGGAADGDGPVLSPGCARGNATPPTTATTADLQVWRKFPAGYDGVTPMPLILAFHATNYLPQNMLLTLTNGQPAAARYVVVAPLASPDLPSNFESYQPRALASVLEETLAELCVDENRIFASGSGSGGRFLIRLVDYELSSTSPRVRFRAVGIVGTYFSGGRNRSVPTIFIHPFDSPNSAGVAQDRDGTKAIALFRTRNVCGESSTPADVAGCLSGTKQVNPGCVDFDACAAPLRWCHHDDPFSSTSGDPWPCFASAAIFEFFDSLGG